MGVGLAGSSRVLLIAFSSIILIYFFRCQYSTLSDARLVLGVFFSCRAVALTPTPDAPLRLHYRGPVWKRPQNHSLVPSSARHEVHIAPSHVVIGQSGPLQYRQTVVSWRHWAFEASLKATLDDALPL